MTTTLKLVETFKIDTRRDGAISYIDVRVVLDGVEMNANFRARIGEEPIVIEGDTITVSDVQIESKRKTRDHFAAENAKRASANAGALDAARAKLDGFITTKNAGPVAAAELRAHFAASADAPTFAPGDRRYDAYTAGIRAIAARHAL